MILISLNNKNPESNTRVKAERSKKQRSSLSESSDQMGQDPVYAPPYHFLSPPMLSFPVSCLYNLQTSMVNCGQLYPLISRQSLFVRTQTKYQTTVRDILISLFYVCGHPAFPTPFVIKVGFSSLYVFDRFIKKLGGFISGFFILFLFCGGSVLPLSLWLQDTV